MYKHLGLRQGAVAGLTFILFTRKIGAMASTEKLPLRGITPIEQQDASVLAAIIGRFDGQLHRTSLLKLLFWCEVYAVQQCGQRLTHYVIIKGNHGVSSSQVDTAIGTIITSHKGKLTLIDLGKAHHLAPPQEQIIQQALLPFTTMMAKDSQSFVSSLVAQTHQSPLLLATAMGEEIAFIPLSEVLQGGVPK
jgi:hypothetical protein